MSSVRKVNTWNAMREKNSEITKFSQSAISNQQSTISNWEPKIAVFLCNWCAYGAADLAGVGGLQYSPNVRVIRVPCVGKVNPLFILKALQKGVDGVLVFGCLPGDCHYISGNYVARKRFAVLNSILEFVGVEKQRVKITWISAAEGERFSQVIEETTEAIKALGPAKRFMKQKKE